MTTGTATPTSATTVNELLAQHPKILPVLHELGVHTCCGGGLPLSTAAANAGIDESLLLERVNTFISATAAK